MGARYQIDLADDVRDVLRRSVIDAMRGKHAGSYSLLLPGQLDRKLYDRTMKVIDAAGGKWNRSAKVHIFPRDPREVLGLAVENGQIVNQAKALNQFFTPPDLATYVVRACSIIGAKERVLEPSAGEGALAEAVRNAMAMYGGSGTVECVEIDERLVEVLRRKGFPTTHSDFLSLDPAPDYDAVVMNPPFAVSQDIAHIRHAYQFLRPGGRLAAIAGAGVEFRQDKDYKAFRAWLKRLKGHVEPLPEGSFREAGTDVRTVLVTVRKPFA